MLFQNNYYTILVNKLGNNILLKSSVIFIKKTNGSFNTKSIEVMAKSWSPNNLGLWTSCKKNGGQPVHFTVCQWCLGIPPKVYENI